MTPKNSNGAKFGFGAWLGKPIALIQFIEFRRMDNSHPVWMWNRIAIILLAMFVLISAIVIFLDPWYLNFINNRNAPAHYFFEMLTKLADSAWLLVATGAIIVSLQFASGDKFGGKLHAVWHRVFFTVWYVFYSVAISGMIAVLFKYIISRARPLFVVDNNHLHFEPFTLGYGVESFPSGHATTMGASIIVLCFLFKNYRWLIIPFGLLIASTRFIIGAHFPSDVVAGLLLGGMFAWIYARSMASHRLLFKFEDDGRLALRDEGKGYYRYIPAMFAQGFGGQKVTARKRNS